MTNQMPRPGSEPAELSQSLTDRIAERVVNARLALEAEPTRRRPRRGSDTSLFKSKTEAELRETQSLKQVFREMGNAYRRYRNQTGGPVVPGLRDAAYKFRERPSLPALVAVAAYLDQLDLLS